MATPRIFVSSTCYDLQEIRHNLREFIASFSYEPVMSDYGDIFYEFDKHVQDSCINEISKSQMYILIIGNNYGSIYHKYDKKMNADSVTLSEFKKSLTLELPKMIFINRFVHYDYNNYRRALNDKLKIFFETNIVDKDQVSKKTEDVRLQFDKSYNFSNSSYPYIFKFIDIVKDLTKNNAIFDFESIDDIKNNMKKQWAGYLYENLTNERSFKVERSNNKIIEDLKEKMDMVVSLISEISQNSTSIDGKLSISIKEIEDSVQLNQFHEARELLDTTMRNILYEDGSEYEESNRLVIKEELTIEKLANWLNRLESLLNTYKWSKYINVKDLFFPIEVITWDTVCNISINDIFKLNSLYKKIPNEEIDNFIYVIIQKMNPLCNFSDFEEDIPF